MAYNGLTDLGTAYLAKCLANQKPVVFTKVKVGDGSIPSDKTGQTTTELYSFKKEVEILSKEQQNTAVKLSVLLNNINLEQGFYVKELGIYIDDDGIEKLYWYINKDTPSFLFDKNTPSTHRYNIYCEVSSTESTIINFTGEGLLIDKKYFDEKVKTYQIFNVEEMKKNKKLKVGDIVELLGYYQAGDGADHKRIISTSDDGSGIQLANDLWANIAHHNGEVNISWFGAKGNGEDDDGAYFQKAFNTEKVLVVFYDKDYWIKSIVDNTGKNKILKGLNQKRQDDDKSGKTLYMNGGKFKNLFKVLGVNAKGVDKNTDIFCEQPYCYMRYVEDCDFKNFLNVFTTNTFMGMFNMRNVSFISIKNACIKFDYGTKVTMCTVSNFENVIVYSSNHFIDGDYAELITFSFKNIVFEEMFSTPIKASIITQCTFDNVWLEKGDTASNKYMIITRIPQLIYATTFNNIRRHGLWELYNENTGGGVTFPRKEDEEQLFQFRNNRGYSTDIGGGVVEKGESFTRTDNKLHLRAKKKQGYGAGTVEVNLDDGQFIVTGYNNKKISRQDLMKIQKETYDISLESKNENVAFVINDKIFNLPQIVVFDKNTKINSDANGLVTVTEKSAGIIEITLNEQWRYPAISITINSEEDFYVYNTKFIESYLGGWKEYGDAKAIQVTFKNLSGTLKTPQRILFQLFRDTRNFKKTTLQLLQENFSEKLMKDENVYDDYLEYKTLKNTYDKKQEQLEKDKYSAYEEELKQNPDLTYEKFLQNHQANNTETYARRRKRSLMIEDEEPQIPQLLKDFIEKYL